MNFLVEFSELLIVNLGRVRFFFYDDGANFMVLLRNGHTLMFSNLNTLRLLFTSINGRVYRKTTRKFSRHHRLMGIEQTFTFRPSIRNHNNRTNVFISNTRQITKLIFRLLRVYRSTDFR